MAHPHPSLGLATWITLARGGLVGLLAGALASPRLPELSWPLFAVGSLAFALDAVDGRVARARGEASPLGAQLDMELDGLTVFLLSALLWQLDRAGAWVLTSGAFRYLFVLGQVLFPWMRRPLFPTPRRAWACGAQVTLLLAGLVPWPHPSVAVTAAAGGVGVLAVSFGLDTLWLWRHR